MSIIETRTELSEFARVVSTGLTSFPKKLDSMYFYDEKGDRLFQEIMTLDEYYLTRAEFGIFKNQGDQIVNLLQSESHYRLIELGAGDGSKTKLVLKHLLDAGIDFSYSPVDISGNVLEILKASLGKDLPGLQVEPLEGDYFKVLESISFSEHEKKVVFFLGSNIGNYLDSKAIDFLRSVRRNLNVGDKFVIGVDLKKDPKTILAAYNDVKGVTAAFNMNLLDRINRELGANFDKSKFIPRPVYDPLLGECRSYLLSTCDQEIYIESSDDNISFDKWEPIFMEVSKKYSIKELESLADQCGFRVVRHLFDKRHYYTDSFWEAV
jgi:dimethylhistidine N-methyltransferase